MRVNSETIDQEPYQYSFPAFLIWSKQTSCPNFCAVMKRNQNFLFTPRLSAISRLRYIASRDVGNETDQNLDLLQNSVSELFVVLMGILTFSAFKMSISQPLEHCQGSNSHPWGSL